MVRLIAMRLLVAAVALGLWPSWAEGQPAHTGLERVEVAIWPEYDRPKALVMYRFRVAPGIGLPATLAVPIPAAVGEPHAVAWRDEAGALLVASSTRRVEGERAMIFVEMPGREGQLEFYDELTIEGRSRSYRFAWPGGVDVGALSVGIQRPVGASRLDLSPPADRQTVGQDGLTHAWIDLGPQGASSTPTVLLKYERETTRLSVEELFARPSSANAPPSSLQAAPEADGALLPWLLGGLAGVIFAFGLSAYLRSSRGTTGGAADGSGLSRRGGEPSEGAATNGEVAFCHECGTKVGADDAFCRKCGTRLRRE
jgi:hypothetical protein